MKNKYHTLKWFENRIGKRVWPIGIICKCKECQEMKINGIVSKNKKDACYNWSVGQGAYFFVDRNPNKKRYKLNDKISKNT